MMPLILTTSPLVARGQFGAREFASASEMLAHYAAVEMRIRSATIKPAAPASPVAAAPPPSPPSDPFAASRRDILAVLDPVKLDRQPKRIIARVAAEHGFTAADLIGPRRTAPIVSARFSAIAAVWDVHRFSPARLGHLFGHRDQATIRYALQITGRMPVGATLRRRSAR